MLVIGTVGTVEQEAARLIFGFEPSTVMATGFFGLITAAAFGGALRALRGGEDRR